MLIPAVVSQWCSPPFVPHAYPETNEGVVTWWLPGCWRGAGWRDNQRISGARTGIVDPTV